MASNPYTKRYSDADLEIYSTDLYGGSDSDVAGTELFTSAIDLSANKAVVIDIKHDSSGTTDDLTVNIYRSLDTTWDGDETAINSVAVPSDGSEDIYSLGFGRHNGYGPGIYRLGLVRSGSTDTFDVEAKLRYDRT
jgi:hypothetical protein